MRNRSVIVLGMLIVAAAVAIVWAKSSGGSRASNQAITYTSSSVDREDTQVHGVAHAHFPVFAGLGAEQQVKMNAMMAEVAQKRVEAFFKNLGDASRSDVGPRPDGSTLDLSFEVMTPKEHSAILDVVFTETSYYQGAAHPGTIIFSDVFDVRTAARLTLPDLFEKTPYEKIAALARDVLQKQFAAQEVEEGGWFPEGVAPKDENFQVFALTDDGLELIFNEYQVAPYAAGPQRVTLSLDELSSLQPRVWR